MKSPLSQFAGQYQEWLAVASLRDHVSRVWVNDLTLSAARDYYVVPDGCVDILWTGESLCVAGPDTQPILEQVRRGCRVVGVRFRPGAAYPWLGVPLSEILNARVPLAEYWKHDASELAEHAFRAPHPGAVLAVLQRALLGRLATVGPADQQIAFLRANALTKHHDSKAGGLKELSLQRDPCGACCSATRVIGRFVQDIYALSLISPHEKIFGSYLYDFFAFDGKNDFRTSRWLAAVEQH